MPIIKDKEKQGPVIALVAICLIVFLFVWRFALSQPQTVAPMAVIKTAPRIDFDYLQRLEFDSFVDYEKIQPLEEELMGKDNPFLPY